MPTHPLTVRELIVLLSTYDPNALVFEECQSEVGSLLASDVVMDSDGFAQTIDGDEFEGPMVFFRTFQ